MCAVGLPPRARCMCQRHFFIIIIFNMRSLARGLPTVAISIDHQEKDIAGDSEDTSSPRMCVSRRNRDLTLCGSDQLGECRRPPALGRVSISRRRKPPLHPSSLHLAKSRLSTPLLDVIHAESSRRNAGSVADPSVAPRAVAVSHALQQRPEPPAQPAQAQPPPVQDADARVGARAKVEARATARDGADARAAENEPPPKRVQTSVVDGEPRAVPCFWCIAHIAAGKLVVCCSQVGPSHSCAPCARSRRRCEPVPDEPDVADAARAVSIAGSHLANTIGGPQEEEVRNALADAGKRAKTMIRAAKTRSERKALRAKAASKKKTRVRFEDEVDAEGGSQPRDERQADTST